MYQLAPWNTQVSYDEYVEQSRVSIILFQGLLRYIDGWEGFMRIANQVHEFGPHIGWNGFLYAPSTNHFKPIFLFNDFREEILSYVIDRATEQGALWNDYISRFKWFPKHLNAEDVYLVCSSELVTVETLEVKAAIAFYILDECSQLYAEMTLGIKPVQRILDTQMEDYYYMASLT